MKILFVISKYYPKIGGTPNCVRNIVHHLREEHDVQVLTTRDEINDPCEMLCEGVRVHKVMSYKHIALSDLLRKGKVSFIKRLSAVMGKVFCHLLRCEDGVLKRRFARRIKKLQRTENYDFVVAVAGDIVPAKAVLTCKASLLKTAFYQLDPYTTNATLPETSQDSRCKLEKEIHQSFDLIFTTDIIRKEMSQRFPLGDNVHICNFPTIKDRTATLDKSRGGEISFLYCGAMYAARNMDFCLSVLDEMTRLDERFVFDFYVVGDTSAIREYSEKNNRIHLFPPVSPEKIHGIMAEHDVLMNIGNVMTNQVPSKMYDYISTGLPIVNFIYNKDCPTIEVLSSYPAALTVSPEQSVNSAAQEVCSFAEETVGHRVEYPLIEKTYYENTVACVTERMISNMQRIGE